MILSDIPYIRLQHQQLAGTELKSPQELISTFCAIQAQDPDMCKWGIGARLPKCTIKIVNHAMDKGDILRTHVLRPTWHLVSRGDIYWLIDLTAKQVMAAMKTNDKRLGLDEATFTKSNKLIEKALTANKHLTREEIFAGFDKIGIDTSENRSSHLLMRAECEGIICSGITKGKQRTYTLLPELIPRPQPLTKDEALAKLAKAYFTSRSPATLKDFEWWSGLSITEARHALEMIKYDLVSETIGDQTYWLCSNFTIPKPNASLHLLPAFDEYLISYTDRSASIALKHQPHAFTNNGIFKPIIIANGKATGIWKRTVNKDKVIIETNFFAKANKKFHSKLNKAAKAYARFLDKELILI